MKWTRRAKSLLDRILDALVSLIFAGMTILIILLVILRYFFNSSIPGGNEVLRFAFMYTTFLGAAVLIGHDEHIAIHLLTRRFPRIGQRIIAVANDWIIVALHVYLLVLSFRWIAVTGGNLAEELDFPMRFVQIALPIGAGLAALYAFSNSLDAIFDRDWKGEGSK
jgi:TRAP-type transport system small permease protein